MTPYKARWILGAFLVAAIGLRYADAQQRPQQHRRDLAGTWQVTGWPLGSDPSEQPTYHGTVDLDNSAGADECYRVVWHLPGNHTIEGVAIYHDDSGTLAVSYTQADDLAVAMLFEDGPHHLMGAWTTHESGGVLGFESWGQ